MKLQNENAQQARSEQDSLGFLLADLSRLMRRAFQQRSKGDCLTLAQARALVYIARHSGVRQVELAELLEIKPITLVPLIDQLSDIGLVERCPDPIDRRAYRIYLTSAAPPHLNAIKQVTEAIQADALRGISQQEITTVLSALSKMRDNFGLR